MAVVTKRKVISTEKLIASEYRRYLKNGGTSDPKKVQVAAFDRIADKHLRPGEIRQKLDKIEVRR
jgi:hypothetical protein